MVLVLLPPKVQRKPRRCRGCFVPFFRKKVSKNSPADAFAYFVPSNVRNGRLFAGLQANRPRFLPLLAGPSFHGSASGRDRSRRNAAGGMRPGQAGSTEAYDRPWKRDSTAAFSLVAEREQPPARVPGAGGCIVLFLLRPLNAGRRLFPRKRHADGFGAFNFATLVFLLLARHSPQAVSARAACVGCHQKVAIRRGTRRGSVFSAGQRSEHANKGCSPLFACSRRTGRRTGRRAG